MAKTKRVAAGRGSGSDQYYYVNRSRSGRGKTGKKSVAKRPRRSKTKR